MLIFESYYILFLTILVSIYIYLYLSKFYKKDLDKFFNCIHNFCNEIKETIDLINGVED